MSKIKYVSSSGLTHYDEKIKKVIDEVDTSTNTKVTQTPTSTDASYPLLLSPSGQTQETNTTSYFNSDVVLNPSTKTISANIDGNAKTATSATSADSATKATQDGDGNVITDTYALNSNVNANLNNTLKSDGYKRPSTNQILNWFRMHYGYEESDTIYMLVTAIAGDNEEYRNVTLFAYKYNEYPTKVRTIKNIGMSITAYNEIGTVAYSVQTNIKISAIVLQRDLFHSLYDLADTYAKKSIYGDTVVSMGRKANTTVGTNSVAFGNNVTASGYYSHAEGNSTTASESCSHAEGTCTTASGIYSHAEGSETTASGIYSHAEGNSTTALTNQHAQGHYNNTTNAKANSTSGTSDGTAFVIGNGIASSKSNAFRVRGDGVIYATNATVQTGADYAEYFEWSDGNPNEEDRVGYFVTFDEDNPEKIRIASKDDYILGIVSGMPNIIGNGDECWKQRYILDDFGRYIEETFEYEVEVPEVVGKEVEDEETGETKIVEEVVTHKETKIGTKWKENPEYDQTKAYIPRDERAEWSAVGMLGVLSVYDDGTCQVNGYCKVADGGIATACEKGEGYRIIKRVSDNIVKVVLK